MSASRAAAGTSGGVFKSTIGSREFVRNGTPWWLAGRKAEVIDTLSEMRQEAAHPCARFSVLAEFERALHHLSRLAKKLKVLAFAFERLAVKLFQLRLVVKRVEMTDTPAAENLYDPFRFW